MEKIYEKRFYVYWETLLVSADSTLTLVLLHQNIRFFLNSALQIENHSRSPYIQLSLVVPKKVSNFSTSNSCKPCENLKSAIRVEKDLLLCMCKGLKSSFLNPLNCSRVSPRKGKAVQEREWKNIKKNVE